MSISGAKMDPITIGIAISSAKLLIEKAVEVKDIAGALDGLFHASDTPKKVKKKKKPITRMQQILRIRSGDADDDDETSISSVASDILAQKQNEIALHNLGIEIDRKWGRGTFDLIKDEREKRIAEKEVTTNKAKDAAKERRAADAAMWDNVMAYIMGFLKVSVILIIASGVGYLIWINRCTGEVC